MFDNYQLLIYLLICFVRITSTFLELLLDNLIRSQKLQIQEWIMNWQEKKSVYSN